MAERVHEDGERREPRTIKKIQIGSMAGMRMRSVSVISARLLSRPKKNRDKHETGPVRGGHQEGPDYQIAEADAHAHPSWVARPNQSIDPEANKRQSRQPANGFVADARGA